jgi:hypothetical protein
MKHGSLNLLSHVPVGRGNVSLHTRVWMRIRVALNFCNFGRGLWWTQELPDNGVFRFWKERL